MRFVALSLTLSLVVGATVIATASSSINREPLPTALQNPDLAPDGTHGAIAAAVARTMVSGHYSAGAIDDLRSGQWLQGYIERLDPQRLYFVQKDIDEFRARWGTLLDDDVFSPHPKLEAPYAIHQRFRQRVGERIDTVQTLLAEKVVTDDPSRTVQLDREDAPWASSPGDLDGVWRARIAAQVIELELGEKSDLTSVERLKRRYERIRREAFDVDVEDILEVWLAALTETFDPHSVWFKPVSKENFDIDMQDTLIGIGAVLNYEDGYTVIKELVVGGPANRDGRIKPGDRIVAVGQGNDAPVDVVEMRLDRVVQLIRGKEGSPVRLTIKPADAEDPSQTELVDLVREKVKLSQSASKGELRTIPGASGSLNLGLIDVPSFYEDVVGAQAGDANYGSTARDVATLIRGWQEAGTLDGVVVDLRNNGGGSLDQALELTGLFLPGGPVVQVRGRNGEIEVLKDPDPAVLYSGPVVVLTSELAASASEIFAAALQDYGRALIVGAKTTHGKGTVQNMIGLERQLLRMGELEAARRGGAIKFTTHMFYRVNGDSTQLNGVAADVYVPSPYEGLDIREGDLDYALPWDQIPAASYRPRKLGADLVALQAAVDARVATDREFVWMKEDLARRASYEDLTEMKLDLGERRAELDADKARDEARKAARVAAGLDEKAELDPVLDEGLRVAVDFVEGARSSASRR